MPSKITKNVQSVSHFAYYQWFVHLLEYSFFFWSHSYFAQHIFSNGKIRSTKRAWSYFSYSHYVAMLGDNRIKNKKQQISVSNFSG